MQAVETKKDRTPRNGVDTPTLFATLDAVKAQPDLAKFQFRVSNRWMKGTNSRSRMEMFKGAGGEHAHKGEYALEADHPTVLVGDDMAPTPVEFLLHALAGCITAGIANIAAARGVTLTEVTSRIEATSISSGSSDSQRRFGTATSASGRRSTSRATPRRRSSARSWSSPRPAPRCSTS